MRILIAEDDTIIADGLSRSLRQGGYAVDWAPNGVEADTALVTVSYDLLILDLGLPKMSGLEVLKRLRARNSQLPVLILTALDGTGDRVKGLDLGADDYMVKPFELAELEARVRALTRRSAGTSPTIQCGALTYDQVGRVAQINSLMRRAGATTDQKEIQEVTARIGAESALLQHEVSQIELMRGLAEADQRVADSRAREGQLEQASRNRRLADFIRD